jgi:ABC-type Fe3+/spermidine/putrescine transport system ATPase subunit
MSIKDVGDLIIVVEHINKTFANGVKAVVDFTTKIQRGEVVVVIGPSGSGKSTFLRCLNGLEEIDSGSIVIDGTSLDESSSTAYPWTTARKTGWKFARRSVWSFSSSIFSPT